jgi:peptidoglycan lytic transglycosylase
MRQRPARLTLLGLVGVLVLGLAGCGSPGPEGAYKLGAPYQIAGRWYYPEFDPNYDKVGIASWYGREFHGHATANGETFDRHELTAAHPTLPLPSIVRVTNLANQRQLELRVNDRGPFVGERLIDLSQEAARELGFERQGIARVRIQFVGLADAKGEPPRPTRRYAQRVPRTPPPMPPGTLVAETSPPSLSGAVIGTAQAATCGGRFIQIGAFAEPERAVRAVTRLQGVTVMPVSVDRPSGDRLTRVRLGPITDSGAVEAALDQLKQSGYSGAFIVRPEAPDPARC